MQLAATSRQPGGLESVAWVKLATMWSEAYPISRRDVDLEDPAQNCQVQRFQDASTTV